MHQALFAPALFGASHQRREEAAKQREASAMQGASAAAQTGAAAFKRALPWQIRLRIVRDAARGLAYLHTPHTGKGCVLHRDS